MLKIDNMSEQPNTYDIVAGRDDREKEHSIYDDDESSSDDDGVSSSDDDINNMSDQSPTDDSVVNSDDSKGYDSIEDHYEPNIDDESEEDNVNDENYEPDSCEGSDSENEYKAPNHRNIFDPFPNESHETLNDTDHLLKGKGHKTLKDLLKDCSLRFDIDSVIISSNFIRPIIQCLEGKACFKINSNVSPIHASQSSRLRVYFDEHLPMMNHSKKCNQLSLAKFPNIALASVTIDGFNMNLHFFWLKPPYMPKVSYFEDKYMLPITAALNLARLSLRGNIIIENGYIKDQHKTRCKKQSTHLLPFNTHSCIGTKSKPKEVSKETALAFFSYFQDALKYLSTLDLSKIGVTLHQLLPSDINNKSFPETATTLVEKESFIAALATDLADSQTFTISCSGKKGCFYVESPSPVNLETYFEDSINIAKRVLGTNLKKRLFDEDHYLNENVHIYYDIGLEIDHVNPEFSLVPDLATSSKLLKNVMYTYNEKITNALSTNDASSANNNCVSVPAASHDAKRNENGNSTRSNKRKRPRHENNNTSEMADIEDHRLWTKISSPNQYSVLFLTGYGNWHSGNTKTRRIMDSSGSVFLEHTENGMMTGCHAYSPELRLIQSKETKDVIKDMDSLAATIVKLIENKQLHAEDHFNKLIQLIQTHLCDLKRLAVDEFTTPTSVRIECLMKVDTISRFMVNFPVELVDTEIGIFETKRVHNHYRNVVNESVNCLLSLMPVMENNILKYKRLSKMSPSCKTVCIFHAERLACEFGNLNLQGTIMKNLKKKYFMGSVTIPQHLQWPLSLEEEQECNPTYGICPSLLPMYKLSNYNMFSGTILDLSKFRLPISRIYREAYYAKKQHTAYEKHLHILMSLIHKTLLNNRKGKKKGP